MNLQGTRYDTHIKADAIELIVYYKHTITEVSTIIGCSVHTISRWYSEYLGYRGDDKEVVVLPSRINEMSDNREYHNI